MLLVVLVLLVPRMAAASRPVIGPGREDEIIALLDPHHLGDELSPGWTLHSFAIEMSTIELWIAGPEGTFAGVALDHPEHAQPDARPLTGFALTIVEGPPGSEAALDELVATLARNDDGAFWGRELGHTEGRSPPTPPQPELLRWLSDGLLLFGAFTLVLVVLALRTLRGEPAWMRWSLLGIVGLGALLRVGLSEAGPLGVWSYTRLPITAALIYEGPLLALVHPQPLWMSELILDSTLYFALLAPLAAHVHASYLLGDKRLALLVAALLAVLPLHLRFSHGGTAFIPTLTLGSLVFIFFYVATRESNRALGWLALPALAAALAILYQLRPLNLVYGPLLLASLLVDRDAHADAHPSDAWRRGAALLVVVALTLLGLTWLFAANAERIDEGLDPHTLVSALRVALHPRWNILLNPVFTPPGLTLLAGVGAVQLWRRNRRLALFVLGWLFAFLVLHSYYVPMSVYMQARYHLHLIPPYLLLAAHGIAAVLGSPRVGRRRPVLVAGLAAYLLASPLIHIHAIRHVQFNEVREHHFVHALRDVIPPQCTIIEFVGIGADSRFDRVGRHVEAGTPQSRWTVVEIPLAGIHGDVELPDYELPAEVRALLDAPPDCLYWYAGLPCLAFKPPDQPAAYACVAVEHALHLEEVATITHASIPYDENLAIGLGERDGIDLHLYRAITRGMSAQPSAQQRKPVE